jgi:hypothetical protein
MHYLSLVYCINTPLYLSGVSAAYNLEVEYIYVANSTFYTSGVDCQRAWVEWNSTEPSPADIQLRSITSNICHIYTLYLQMMSC